MDHGLTVRQLFSLVDRQAWLELGDLFTDDALYLRPGYEPIRGRPALVHFYRDVRQIRSGRHVIHELVGAGDVAACWGDFAGISRNGEPLAVSFAEWYRFAGGQIAARRTFFDRPAV